MFNKRVLNVVFVLFLAIILIMGGCTAPSPTSTYTITVTAGTGGQIDPEGEVVISEEGSQTFTITTDGCYTVDDVLVDGVSVGPVTTYTFEDIQEDHTIQATFVSGPKVSNTATGVDYTLIQEAINAALAGETIIVCPGTYHENLVFNGRNITVQSTDPSDSAIVAATIIDGGGSGHVVDFFGGDTSTLQGFTIRNGNAYDGGGIYVADSYSTITGNTITDNAAEHYGGGIYVSSSTLTITGNTITDNTAVTGGGGIYVADSYSTITGNTITDNFNSGHTIDGGGGISLNNSSPTVEDNTITSNTAEYFGGGIYVFYCEDPNITGNTITDNTAEHYGGGIALNNSSPTVEDNTITDNTAEYFGGGIYVSSSSDLLPTSHRPNGWGTGREYIPTGFTLDPAEGVTYTIAGNEFLGNQQGDPLDYTEGAHVYFN